MTKNIRPGLKSPKMSRDSALLRPPVRNQSQSPPIALGVSVGCMSMLIRLSLGMADCHSCSSCISRSPCTHKIFQPDDHDVDSLDLLVCYWHASYHKKANRCNDEAMTTNLPGHKGMRLALSAPHSRTPSWDTGPVL